MKRLYLFLCLGLIVLGVGAMAAGQLFLRQWRDGHLAKIPSLSAVASASPARTVTDPASGHPVRFSVPRLHIGLAVTDGSYDAAKKDWTLTEDKVQYATNTPEPNNQEGNTFLYGHNHPEILGHLNQIKPGDQAVVTAINGLRFIYAFRGAIETTPFDTSLFNYRGAPILTVQTCSGIHSQNRELFTFNLIKVEK